MALLLLLPYQVIQVDSRGNIKNQDDERYQVQNEFHSSTCPPPSQSPANYRRRLLKAPAVLSAKTILLMPKLYLYKCKYTGLPPKAPLSCKVKRCTVTAFE